MSNENYDRIQTVGELKERLSKLPDDMPVVGSCGGISWMVFAEANHAQSLIISMQPLQRPTAENSEDEEEDEEDEEDPEWAAYCAATDAIDARVNNACQEAGHKEIVVDYSAYDSDSDSDIPIDNLNMMAAVGKIVLVAPADNFYGGAKSKPYRSQVLINPTWLQVAVCANAMILCTNDHHHCFLEAITFLRTEGDIGIFEFAMGS